MKGTLKNVILFTGLSLFFIFSFFLFYIVKIPEIYSKALGIFFLSATLWITNIVPPAVTGILIIAITPLFNVLRPEETFSAFGNRAVFFILSAFILASSILKTGLAKKITYFFLKFFSKSPFYILSGIFSISFFLSLLIPEHATSAILFPFLLQISHEIKNKKFAKLIFLSMAWGAVSGGIGTPLGGARAPFAIGLYQENFGKIITFFEWTKFAFPVAFLFFIFGILYIFILTRNIQEKVELKNKAERILSNEEMKTLLIYAFALILWIFYSDKIDMAVTGLLACFLLFLFKVINWRDAQHYVNWGIILMYGGAIVLGTSLFKSGTALYISENFLSLLSHHPLILFISLLFLTLILTEFISNVATCALLLPISYGFSNVFDPFFLTLFIAITSGLAFILPFGSPPNAIAFSSGKYSIFDAFKYSIPFFLVSPVFIYFLSHFIWVIMGVKI